MVFLWVQNKNAPNITKPAKQCNALTAQPPLAGLIPSPAAAPIDSPGQLNQAQNRPQKPTQKTALLCPPGYLLQQLAHALTLQLQPIRNTGQNILQINAETLLTANT